MGNRRMYFIKTRAKRRKTGNPYDLSEGFRGFNTPCPYCGKEKDRRSSPYEPIGFIDYCTCGR